MAGDITFEQKGTYLVTAFRKVKGDKEHVPSEKYGKSIIVGKGNAIISKPFGHRIEIIPLKNPSEVKPGESIPIQVLFEESHCQLMFTPPMRGITRKMNHFPSLQKAMQREWHMSGSVSLEYGWLSQS